MHWNCSLAAPSLPSLAPTLRRLLPSSPPIHLFGVSFLLPPRSISPAYRSFPLRKAYGRSNSFLLLVASSAEASSASISPARLQIPRPNDSSVSLLCRSPSPASPSFFPSDPSLRLTGPSLCEKLTVEASPSCRSWLLRSKLPVQASRPPDFKSFVPTTPLSLSSLAPPPRRLALSSPPLHLSSSRLLASAKNFRWKLPSLRHSLVFVLLPCLHRVPLGADPPSPIPDE